MLCKPDRQHTKNTFRPIFKLHKKNDNLWEIIRNGVHKRAQCHQCMSCVRNIVQGSRKSSNIWRKWSKQKVKKCVAMGWSWIFTGRCVEDRHWGWGEWCDKNQKWIVVEVRSFSALLKDVKKWSWSSKRHLWHLFHENTAILWVQDEISRCPTSFSC